MNIDERANALYPTANDADASLVVVSERDGYIRGAKEYEQHLLALQDANETEKQLWIDKACNAFCHFCNHQCKNYPHSDCEVLIEYKQKMEE